MDALKKLYGAPLEKLTDYEIPTKRKKSKKIATKVKSQSGFKIVDFDQQIAVAPSYKEEESDEDDKPIYVEDRELMEQVHYEQKLKRAREERAGWVDVSLQTAHNPSRDLSPPRNPRKSHVENIDNEITVKNNDVDIDPPRKKKKEDLSPPRNRIQDISPPRNRTSKDISPPRNRSKDTSPPRNTTKDISPPRNRTKDISPPRNRSKDISPPRNRSKDTSPPRNRSKDISPPRNRTSKDLSPPRNRSKDTSPPRNRSKDISPPRNRTSKDLSPPRNRTSKDISPPRNRSKDTSPPRNKNQDMSPRKTRSNSTPKSPKTNDKPTTPPKNERRISGLISGKDIEKHIDDQLKQAKEARAKLDPVASGKGADTIHRDKRGRPLTMLNKLINPNSQAEEDDYEWGGGKKDKEAEEEKKRIEEEEKGKPYRGTTLDDEKLNQEYRDAVRFGDPMAPLLAKRLEKKKKKGKSKKREYTGFCPPNRFGIRPGFEWDGVDRSNQYEANLYKIINERGAQEEIALKFAQEDM